MFTENKFKSFVPNIVLFKIQIQIGLSTSTSDW